MALPLRIFALSSSHNGTEAIHWVASVLSIKNDLQARMLAIVEKSYGAEHPNVGRALGNLARLLRDTNRLCEAELLYRRALAIFENSYGQWMLCETQNSTG